MTSNSNEGDCANCPAPLEREFGKWVHHWIFANACRTPELVLPNDKDGKK